MTIASAIACSAPAPPPIRRSAISRPVSGLALAQIWGGVTGALPDRWYVERPKLALLAPDGRWALLGGFGETAVVSAPSGARIGLVKGGHNIAGDSDIVGSDGLTRRGAFAISADSRRFAIVDDQRRCAAIWTIAPLREEACLPAGHHALVAFSPDGASLAIHDDAHVARWSLATWTAAWTVATEAQADGHSFLAWPAPDVLLVRVKMPENNLHARDAANGSVRWARIENANEYLGVFEGDAVVLRTNYWLARIDLATGTARALTGGQCARHGTLLDDGTAVIVDCDGVAQRYRLADQAALGSYPVPWDGSSSSAAITAQRDGRLALTVARSRIVLWDLRAGSAVAIADAQAGSILALDADTRGVVSAAADGSLVVRGLDGGLIERRQARATGCRAAAVSAPGRRAVCAADLTGYSAHLGVTGFVPPCHTWIDLDRGIEGELGWCPTRGPVALDERGRMWVADESGATWIDTVHPVERRSGAMPQRFAVAMTTPRVARLVSRGEAVVYGGVTYSPGIEEAPGGFSGFGLDLMSRDGKVTALDPGLDVVALGADRSGDHLGVATLHTVALWRCTDGHARCAPQWTLDLAHNLAAPVQDSMPTAIAVADDGALVAAAVEAGHVVALYDGATGKSIGAVDVESSVHTVTALAFTSDALYAGTRNGLVLVFALRRGR